MREAEEIRRRLIEELTAEESGIEIDAAMQDIPLAKVIKDYHALILGRGDYLPLSSQAMRYMPERGDAADNDNVFARLPKGQYLNDLIKAWAKEAGLSKHVTFHTSRHTFATMLLTLGADLYTVSKLLGHANVKTTQIYGKIVDQKKDDAVSRIDKAFE